MHAKPQLVPLQVGVALAGAEHATHDAPHESTLVLLAQPAPQV